MAELVDLVRRTAGPSISVETVAAGGLWPTLVDANQLENALLNLCINARDAMPDGGSIVIETGNKWLDARAAAERGIAPGQYVTVCVSDTGVGIDKAIQERVFDPFFTTKPIGEGTGLGLSMVYGFAKQSHGHVRIYSEVGQGTMVCIYLPRHFGEEEIEDAHPAVTFAQPAAGETVLVVDDEPTIRMLIVDALGELGYSCAEAADGPSGLKILQSGARIDLLITDVGLPGGLNGRQVADAARVLRPDLKVLFITGYAENAVLNHGHIQHGMEVLTKPFAVADLAGRVDRMLRAGV
jgi:CheY-like chemotaxis protein